jgi:hypothetical protein
MPYGAYLIKMGGFKHLSRAVRLEGIYSMAVPLLPATTAFAPPCTADAVAEAPGRIHGVPRVEQRGANRLELISFGAWPFILDAACQGQLFCITILGNLAA